ncbi:hypothetical protein B0J17DRAFT_628160 [Rhizoctonia solani]|nr:hypothetical protein B0J17DRAFT_628160 [Rhizoctonia solani]
MGCGIKLGTNAFRRIEGHTICIQHAQPPSNEYAYLSPTSPFEYPYDSGCSNSRRVELEPVVHETRAGHHTPPQVDTSEAENLFDASSCYYSSVLVEIPPQPEPCVRAASQETRADRDRLARFNNSPYNRAGNASDLNMHMGPQTELAIAATWYYWKSVAIAQAVKPGLWGRLPVLFMP